MPCNCTFKDIERISICDGGASDNVEVANQDDCRGAPNTISRWHEVICDIVVTPLYIKLTAVWTTPAHAWPLTEVASKENIILVSALSQALAWPELRTPFIHCMMGTCRSWIYNSIVDFF